MRRRRRRRNAAGAVGTFVHEHPFLFTFFVLPAVLWFPIALYRAIKKPEPAALPSPPINNPRPPPPDIPIV